MAANIFNPLTNYQDDAIVPAIVGSSDTINSSDVGRIVFKSSNTVVLGTGGSSFSTSIIAGVIALVPTASSGGSTVPIYIRPLVPGKMWEGKYSTLYSTVHPSDDYIGSYVGLSSAATVAGALFSMGNLGNEPGTSDARFARITGYSTNRRILEFTPVKDSSVIGW